MVFIGFYLIGLTKHKRFIHNKCMSDLQKFYGFLEVDPNSVKADDAGNVVPTEIEILQTGDWNTPNHGRFSVSASDLDEYVNNFNSGVRKGVPIDLEHKTDGGAVGWVKSLARKGESLFANVEWTKAGAQLIGDRAYRFFSPEFAPSGYKDPEGKLAADRNVLLGGALTNRPLFKNLQAISANDKSTSGLTGSKEAYIIYAEEGEKKLQLDEIRKLDPAALTDEQKSFLETHKAELSLAEVKAFSLEANAEAVAKAAADKEAVDAKAKADADAAVAAEAAKEAELVAASEKGTVSISASDLANLKKAANQGKMAYAELESVKASDKVKSWISASDGSKFKPGAVDAVSSFYLGLTDAQRTTFEKDVVENIATTGVVTAGEIGATDTGELGNAGATLDAKAEEIVKASDGSIKYAQALKKARMDNPQLSKAYEAELRPTNAEVN